MIGAARRAAAAAGIAGTLLAATIPGPAGAQLGAWSNPTAVGGDRLGSHRSSPALAVETSGRLHVVWIEADTGAGDEVRYASRAPGELHWPTSTRVSAARAAGRFAPDVAVDASGRVHAVWAEEVPTGMVVQHSFREPGAPAWRPAEPVRAVAGRPLQWAPVVAADRVGNVHVLWVDAAAGTPDVLYRRRDVDGLWSSVLRVHEVADGDQRDPSVADTPQGELVAVWQDTRDGTSQIYASRLPQFGDAWWPDARLSAGNDAVLHRSPAVAADARGNVRAVWLAEGAQEHALHLARLYPWDPERPYWTPPQEVYRPERGSVLELDVGGGPGRLAVAVWSESRPEASRVYAAVVGEGDLVPTRVDVSRAYGDGRSPVVAVDAAPTALAVWRGVARSGGDDVVIAAAPLPRPEYPGAAVQGWLQYVPREPGCGSGAYVVVGCDGVAGVPILGGEPALATYLGSYVTVRGESVMEGACPHLALPSAVLESSPCPRDTGSVTGVVRVADRPVEGARVRLGEQEVATGPSGRFFLDRIVPGTHPVTATHACSLAAVRPAVTVPRGFLATVPPVDLVRGDTVADCRVDLHDLVRVAGAYKSSPPFLPACVDLDGDGAVSMTDLVWIASAYGRSCPTAWPATGGAAAADVPAGAPRPGDLWLEAATGVRGWEVELVLGAGAGRRAGPGTGGAPAVAADGLPEGAWLVENRFDGETGRAHLGGILLAPAPALRGSVGLAVLGPALDAARHDLRVAAFRLYDDAGRPAGGRVTLRTDRPGRGPVWLPLALGGTAAEGAWPPPTP